MQVLNTWLVVIQDKELYGEPDIALSIVEACDEESANASATDTIEQLVKVGRGRCVPHARRLEFGRFYRVGSLLSLPRNPDGQEAAS